MAGASLELANMNSGSSRRRGCSSRMDETGDGNSPDLDFTLYGSPAPRCCHRSVPVKAKKPVQPPNTPKGRFKARKPLQLPIENILILNEKIENNKREKIKLQLSTKQIKLQEIDDGIAARSRKKLGSLKENGSMDFADDSSSTVDLTIDLSSVTNSEHESDSASEESDGIFPEFPRYSQERSYATSTSTDVPTRSVWHLAEANDGRVALQSPESSETGYPCTRRSSSAHFSEFWDMYKKTSPTFSSQEKQIPQLNLTPNQCRSRSADLIYVYVNTVNNRNELTKYFRPCHVCNQACCICPDTVSESNRSFPVYSNVSRGSEAIKAIEKAIPHSDVPGFPDKLLHGNEILTADKIVETDPEMTDIDGSLGTELKYFDNSALLVDGKQWDLRPQFENRSSEFDSSLINGYKNKQTTGNFLNNEPDMAFDSGTSTLRRDDTTESDSSSGNRKQTEAKLTVAKSITLSVMQLATAAQCARILANSLESVLEIVDNGKEECPEAADLIRFKEEDLNQLCETLRNFKSHFLTSAEEIPNVLCDGAPLPGITGGKSPKKNWIGFEKEEISFAPSEAGKSNSEEDGTSRKCQNLRFEDDFDEFISKV